MMGLGSGFFSSLLGLPWFLLYFVVSAALVALFAFVYTRITGHDEVALIRAGNFTAALALGGSILGFVIPLSKAVQQSVSIPDMLVWGFAAFVVQIAAYGVVRAMVPDLSQRIESNTAAAGTLLAILSVASGLLNAAAMSL